MKRVATVFAVVGVLAALLVITAHGGGRASAAPDNVLAGHDLFETDPATTSQDGAPMVTDRLRVRSEVSWEGATPV